MGKVWLGGKWNDEQQEVTRAENTRIQDLSFEP